MSVAAARPCAALLAGFLVAGCGQKGALYLPEATGEVITRPAPKSEESTPEGKPQSKRADEPPPRAPSP